MKILKNRVRQGGESSCELGGIDYARLLSLNHFRGRGLSMDVSSPLIRQWILLRILSARHYGATVKELADELEVSEKTIRRDLEIFQTAGFPLEETVEEFGRKKWKLKTGANPSDMCLLWDEAAALYMGQRFLEPMAGTPF
jgi:predicted DNA-binding transcriptional regulator YafY